MTQTIPAPSKDEQDIARMGLRIQAEARKLDLSDPAINDFIEHIATVQAQMMAETRWMRNMTHNPADLSEFLAQKSEKI